MILLFYCIYDQINAVSVSIRYLKDKEKSNFGMVMYVL